MSKDDKALFDDDESSLGISIDLPDGDDPFAASPGQNPAASTANARGPAASTDEVPTSATGTPPKKDGETVVPLLSDDASNVAGDGGNDPLSATFLRPGAKIGSYEVREELGVGGMGRVYLAYDSALQRRVAIKMMREHALLSDPGANMQRRFSEEALLPAQINHPNIIAIHDIGHHENCPYFVMEYIEGATTLQDVLNKAKEREEKEFLPLALVKTYFLQAAAGLRALHSKPGVWHRDIKLSNLLVFELPGGGPGLKLIDFGVSHNPDAQLTQDGQILGTPSYLAPEVVEMVDGKP